VNSHLLPDVVLSGLQQAAADQPLHVQFWHVGAGGKPEFAPKLLADYLRAESPMAQGGGLLYRYVDGVYVPEGEMWARQQTAELLGNYWKPHHADSVVTFLRDTAPELWEAPPLDHLNVRNGILDLTTGILMPHNPALLSPVQIAAEFDPEARCPRIEQFASEVFPPDAIDLAWEIAGYLLVPDNRLRKAVMLLGRGRNGKSVFLNVLTALVGAENISNRSLHKLEEDRFAAADLYGKLANVFADIGAGELSGSSLFKSITGGDRISAERKFQPAFSFTPYARLLFSANTPPPTSDSTDAFFDRWVVVPFGQRFRVGSEGGEAPVENTNLLSELTTPQELSGLLNLALSGLERVRAQQGFTRGESTDLALKRFRTDVDSVAGFVNEDCTINMAHAPSGEIISTERKILYEAYQVWCEDNGKRALSAARFYERLRSAEFGLAETARNGVWMFKYICPAPNSCLTRRERGLSPRQRS